jgi:hypothetical protein
MAARETKTRRTTQMSIAHTIANCFMGLIAVVAVAAQTALVSGFTIPV